MIDVKPDQFYCGEVDYSYKDEHYSVRDNGAVLRHPREISRLRSADTTRDRSER